MSSAVPFLLFLLLMLLPAISAQASSLEEIQRRGSLRVGMSGDYQPFSACVKMGEVKSNVRALMSILPVV